MQIMIFYYFSLALLGAIMGSFVGALTWRMKRGLNWLSGRSECEHCHHRLAPTDMIPIIWGWVGAVATVTSGSGGWRSGWRC